MMQPLIPQVSPWSVKQVPPHVGAAKGAGPFGNACLVLQKSRQRQGAVAGSAFSQVSPRKVGKGGLEPPRLSAHDPKSCSSTNSDTSPRDRERAMPSDYSRPTLSGWSLRRGATLC